MRTPRLFIAAVLLGLVWHVGAAGAQERHIRGIDVLENTRTDRETVLLIAGVEDGDEFNDAMLTEIDARLVGSELFKEVNVESIPYGDGVHLIITAKDKLSWIVAPTVYLQPGNRGAGFGFAHANLFGRNKKLLLYGQMATADSMFLAGYLDPSINGTRWYYRVDTFLRRLVVSEFARNGHDFGHEQVVRSSTELYLNGGVLLGLKLSRHLSLDGRLRGARVSFSDVSLSDGVDPAVVNTPAGGATPAPGSDGWDISTEGKLTFDKRANYYGVTSGYLAQLAYEHALPQIGSAFNYWVGTARLVFAKKFYQEHNLILKMTGLVGWHLPFQQEFVSGGTDMRGYLNQQFRGDRKGQATVEYSVPLFKIGAMAFRALAFSDNAVIWYTPRPLSKRVGSDAVRNYVVNPGDDSPTSRIVNGVGGGFRVYVKSVVIPLLGVNAGYGIEANDFHIYFAVGLTEL